MPTAATWGAEGGVDTQSDSEIHFKGSLESDMGLTYTVHVELEGNAGAEIDESFVRIGGGFGQVEFGARDHVMVRMHSGISDVGVGLTSGDTQKWIPGTYLETAGHAFVGGDDIKLNYTIAARERHPGRRLLRAGPGEREPPHHRP